MDDAEVALRITTVFAKVIGEALSAFASSISVKATIIMTIVCLLFFYTSSGMQSLSHK